MASFKPTGYHALMDQGEYQRLKQVVMEALEREPGAREAFVLEALADHAELRERALRMITHAVSEDFLATSAVAVDEQHQAESMIGQTIGRIRIDALLARGGMGEVYQGFDVLLEREVAVKLVRQQWRLSPQRREAFLAEARALSSLAHPHICQVYDFFADDEDGNREGDDRRDVLVLELIEGRTVRKWLDESGKPSRRTALQIALQIAEALVSAHERGIAHRDLKPDNVMLTTKGQVKVLDFGLARSVPLEDVEPDGKTGTMMAGTPGYLAPEQARGETTTTASDLWSFGCLLIELLTGKAPFDTTQTRPSLLEKARQGLVTVPHNQPRAETALLKKLLAAEPSQRPSARELRDRLKRIIERPRRRLKMAAAVAAVVVIAGAGLRYTIDLQTERDRAEMARAEAEDLARFMLEDLYAGLLNVGRLELLEPVADKTVEYFVTRRSDQPDRADTGLALMRAAQVLDYQGRLDEAVAAMSEALERLRVLQVQRPEDPMIPYHLADGLTLLSLQQAAAGQYGRALASARESVALAEDLLAEPDRPDNGKVPTAEKRRELMVGAWFALADGLARAGQLEPAIAVVDSALAHPVTRSLESSRRDLLTADLHWVRCLALLERDLGDVEQVEACTPSLRLDRAALEASPDDANARRKLSNSLWLMGRAQRQSGQAQAALAHSAEAETLIRGLIAWDPEQLPLVNQLVVILIVRARALDDLGRESESIAVLNEALELTRTMVGDGEDQMVMHNHATVLALLGPSEQARHWAARLLDSGWNRPGFLRLCRAQTLDSRCAGDSS